MILALFILGLAIGSFLNVASMRYSEANPKFLKTWGGRSHCPLCGQTLNWYELIPVLSFLIQLGRCRHCHGRISLQYPIVELATAIIFALLASFTGLIGPIGLIVWLIASAVLIYLAAVDARLFLIPDGASLALAVLGLLLAAVYGEYFERLAAGVGAAAFFGAIVLITGGKGMGMGDVKLAGALGLLLGWPDILWALLSAFVIGAIFGVTLIILGKKNIKDAVPFGPFLVVGTFVAVLWGSLLFDILNI